MSEPTAKRRWLRFGLRTLFVVVTVFCVWLGWQLHIVRVRREMLETIEPLDVFVTSSPVMRQAIQDYYVRHPEHPRKALTIPFYRAWLGDEAIVQIATFGNYDEAELMRFFPEAEVMYDASRGLPGK
jgi:hypothetical protein